jgi:hypothetical protein
MELFRPISGSGVGRSDGDPLILGTGSIERVEARSSRSTTFNDWRTDWPAEHNSTQLAPRSPFMYMLTHLPSFYHFNLYVSILVFRTQVVITNSKRVFWNFFFSLFSLKKWSLPPLSFWILWLDYHELLLLRPQQAGVFWFPALSRYTCNYNMVNARTCEVELR